MNTVLAALCVLFGALSSPLPDAMPVAVGRTADIADIPLKAPPGWKAKTDQGAMVMTPGDLEEGKVYTVLVTPMQTKAGSLDEVYDVAKKVMGEVGTFTEATKPQQALSDGGWGYKLSIGMVEKDGKSLLAQAMAIKKGDIGGVLIVIADSIETLQKYADPFTDMVRSLGGSGKRSATPEIARAAGTVDLQYIVPRGWSEMKMGGASIIEASENANASRARFTLVVLPSQPLANSLRDSFRAYWKELVTANYVSEVVPLPLMARLSDGYVCAFDADSSARHKTSDARPRAVALYLLARGNRFVPILAIIYGYEKTREDDLERFLATASIPGASTAHIALFSTKDVTGDWSEGSSEIASYVNSRGEYAGDASIYTGNAFILRPDGTYNRVLVAITGSTHVKEKQAGKWSIEENELVLHEAKGVRRYTLLGSGMDPKVGRFLVLGSYANVKANPSFCNPRGVFQGKWYKSK